MDEADKLRADTHKMVADMHRALMEPQLGHGEKSLVQRMADVTVSIESGNWVAAKVIRLAAVLAAVGTIWTFFHFVQIGGKQ